MFLIKGNKRTCIGEIELLEKCRVCKSAFSISIKIFQRYTHLFFIPLFPYKKEVEIRCVTCNTILEDKALDSELLEKAKLAKKDYSAPIWTYLGSLFIICFILFILKSTEEDKKEAISYIEKPIIGDYYVFKEEYPLKRYYKIVLLSSDTIGFHKNKTAEKKSWKLVKSKKLEYDTTMIKFSKRDLFSLFNKSQIRIDTDSIR